MKTIFWNRTTPDLTRSFCDPLTLILKLLLIVSYQDIIMSVLYGISWRSSNAWL